MWHEAYTVELTEGDTLEEKHEWLNNNIKSYTTYIIEINEYGISFPYNFFSFTKPFKQVTIHLKGTGSIRNVPNIRNINLILDGNLTISGSLSIKENGHFIMNPGTKITKGRVSLDHGTFTMNGGEILGNTANSNGGGVYIGNVLNERSAGTVTFTKTGGTITGSNSTKGNVVNGSFDDDINGCAVYAYDKNIYNTIEKRKETTAEPGDNLYFSSSSQTWSGAWDY